MTALTDTIADKDEALVNEVVPDDDRVVTLLADFFGELLIDAVEDVFILPVGDVDAVNVLRGVVEGSALDDVHALIFELSVPLFDFVIAAENVVRYAVADIVGPRTPAPGIALL